MTETTFELPKIIKDLVHTRNQLRQHYQNTGLMFTLDGKLVGDIGEAVAVELFGITLQQGQGIDGFAADGRSVQVKATGTRNGPNFRYLENRAQHLLFFSFSYESLTGEVIFNGPEAIALQNMPKHWNNQRQITWNQIQIKNNSVPNDQRLKRIK